MNLDHHGIELHFGFVGNVTSLTKAAFIFIAAHNRSPQTLDEFCKYALPMLTLNAVYKMEQDVVKKLPPCTEMFMRLDATEWVLNTFYTLLPTYTHQARFQHDDRGRSGKAQ